MLPPQQAATTELVLLLALLAGALTFSEYTTRYPSLVEFRDAPPVNRLRFACLFVMVVLVTSIFNNSVAPSTLSATIHRLGELVGGVLDFPWSPARLAILMLPAGGDPAIAEMVRCAAGLVCLVSLLTIGRFLIAVHRGGWPSGSGTFNVWINLPLFDPTTGGDVIRRLQRDGRVNIVLGLLLPFLIPAAVRLASFAVVPMVTGSPNLMIWLLCAWGFLPASMIMRGIALLRVAALIATERRLACERAKELQTA